MAKIEDLTTHVDKFVTPIELATYWGVSDRAVRYWVEKGALKASRVGKLIKIPIESAREFGPITEIITGPIASAQ